MKTESLNFTIRLVASEADLLQACLVRSAAYGRELPQLGATMAQPDALDQRADTVVILARDKRTGQPVGTGRICPNDRQRLLIEQSLTLPEEFAGLRLAEVTRLAVHPDNRDPAVRMALLKAIFLAARSRRIDHIVVGVRRPGLVRNYRFLGFREISSQPVALSYAGGLEHHVMAFNVRDLEAQWRAADHALYEWGIETVHPDIQVALEDMPAAPCAA